VRALTRLVLHHEPARQVQAFVALKLVVDLLPLADGRVVLLVDRGRLPRLSLIGVPRLRAVRRDIDNMASALQR